jgi:hypothetical protein
MATRKLHPADVWTRERIGRAISYTAVFVRSPLDGGSIIRRAHSLAQAFAIADALTRRARPLGPPRLRLEAADGPPLSGGQRPHRPRARRATSPSLPLPGHARKVSFGF